MVMHLNVPMNYLSNIIFNCVINFYYHDNFFKRIRSLNNKNLKILV